ncbi:DICT sensory domain-containing protein [Laspinema olomoucense]|uniref:DICT sensory domain-containing protein n=1 Tax=Laspinema olomoucense TaxID=3231600 RepID=UPI0021BADC66|nr:MULTISPECIES: DICT sensory domain-containing protein [unclassified Laspinema]MCT7991295.1 ATP-binding protein [Laspinema sp. D3a]MCT7997434.1 ATP-binding protein [Laspinema sp. D3c]
MSIPTSVLEELLHALPLLRTQIYFKSSLTALSHAMEDQVLAGADRALVIACFQRERFYRQEAHRYRRISNKTDQVYVLAAPETEFQNSSQIQEAIAFEPDDGLAKEWHLVVLAPNYSTCLVCREKEGAVVKPSELQSMDQSRRFEGIWTFDRQVSSTVARLLLERVRVYRPELEEKIERAIATYRLSEADKALEAAARFQDVDPGPFVQRLVTYLQAGQHKLVKTYRSIAAQERRERLVNSITTAIRQSLNPADIFQVAVRELGGALDVCRCLIYRCKATDQEAAIAYEFLGRSVKSLTGEVWPLQENPLFQEVVASGERVAVENIRTDSRITGSKRLMTLVQEWEIQSWLMVPVLYQNQLVGMVELHHCGCEYREWDAEELTMVEAIATQVGVATLQAEAYANLGDLNEQLAALDRTRSNLIAITGHELRTPLSTIQVCLESLASDPDMPPELRQVMLSTALDDAERMRTLVQDFLTLSRLESGRVEWNTEALPLHECLSLAISSVRTRTNPEAAALPTLILEVPEDLPLVRADGEWLVEVLSKLIDNACKFTPSGGKVTILAQTRGDRELEVKVADTGRGISRDRLETVFDRFYQEEGALRRSTGGTGLGLAICRQIVTGWGGQIWAKSGGKDCGSQFHFTIPIAPDSASEVTPNPSPRSKSKSSKGDRSSGSSRNRRTPIG